MKLKGKLTKKEFDALTAGKEYYVEGKTKDGQPLKTAEGEIIYVLDTDDMTHNDDVRQLTSSLETANATVNTHATRIATLEADNKRVTGELDEAKKKPVGKSDDDVQSKITAATTELVNKHKGELAAVQETANGYKSHLDTVMRKNAAITALATPGKGSKRTVGSAELLLPHVLDRTQFVEEKDATGKVTGFKVVVVNEQGTPRIGGSDGSAMTLDQLLDEMYADTKFARAFEPTGKGGGGASGDLGNNNTTTVTKKSDLKTAEEKSQFITDHGSDKYLELPN